MTAPTQQAAPTHITNLSEDPSVRDAIEALLPARVSLVSSADNPERGRRHELDTWGSEPNVYLGVPADARREQVIEALWHLRLLGAGWPDPCDPLQDARLGRIAGLFMVGAARWWAGGSGDRDDDGVRADLHALIGRLGGAQPHADAHVELLCLAGACDADEARVIFAQVAKVSPEVAARAEELLDQMGRLPLTPEEAFDAVERVASHA